MPRSTDISAMPTGRPAAPSRPPTSGAARSPSIRNPTPRPSSRPSFRRARSPPSSADNSAGLPDTLIEPAPAKVNLFLHVTGRRADGYHLLDSLVVFAGVGDALRGEPANE